MAWTFGGVIYLLKVQTCRWLKCRGKRGGNMEYKTDKLRPTQPFLVLETQDFKQEIYLNQGISHFYTFRLEKIKEITTVPDSCVDMLFEYGEKWNDCLCNW